jgi:tricarballylate dehydrogenase
MIFKQKRKCLEGAGPLPLPKVSGTFDVLVIGGGNAALCAAMTAREAGATVLLLESAPRAFRGGNSRHTRNLRCAHEEDHHHLTGIYPEEEFWEDLLSVTQGDTNETLARLTIHQSNRIGSWMEKHGCRFQPAMQGTLLLDRTNAFFLGGGKGLINAYYATAEQLGVRILYEAAVRDLEIEDGRFIYAAFDFQGASQVARARAVVLASGGFQSNLEWLRDSWGPSAENFIIRGTPYNKGRLLRIMLDRGAKSVGDPRQCHAVAIDARAPKFDGGIVTRLDCVPFGIVVNRNGQRFYDEGEDFWPKRYAIWGRLIAQQPDQIAYCLIDAKAIGLFMPSVFLPIEEGSVRALGERLNLDPTTLEGTVSAFNSAVRAGSFNPSAQDSCSTEGLSPPKSHWARRIDTPPYYAYPLRPGITFTYLGLTVNQQAQVIMEDDRTAANIFAAGEIMAGNILGQGYLAGFGMTIGTVFGRLAGKEAAHCAFHSRKRS